MARRLLIDELGLEPGPYLRNVEEQVLLQEGPLFAPCTARSARPPAVGGVARHRRTVVRPLLLRDGELPGGPERQLERWRVRHPRGPARRRQDDAGHRAGVLPLACDDVAWASLTSGAVERGRPPSTSPMRLGVASEASSDADAVRAGCSPKRIGDRPLLLVLDNAEHLVDPGDPARRRAHVVGAPTSRC